MRLKSTVSAVALVASASPALAEMDAVTLWQEFLATSRGIEITASETVETDTSVVLRDVVIDVDDGRDQMQIRFDGFSLTETATGGLVGVIEGDGRLESLTVSERVGADLQIDGLTIGVNDTAGLEVTVAAPILGAVMTETFLNLNGEPQDATAAFSITDLQARFADTGKGAAERRVDMSINAAAFTVDARVRDLDDVGALDVTFSQEAIEVELFGNGPADLFLREDILESDVDFTGLISFGAGALEFYGEGLSGVEDEDSEVNLSFAFDAFVTEAAGHLPVGLEQYPDGRDLVHDDLTGFFRYEIQNALGSFDISERDAHDDDGQGFSASGVLAPSDVALSIMLDEAGDLAVSAATRSGINGAFTEVHAFNGELSTTEMTFAVNALDYNLDLFVPLDNAMMDMMQGLPEGLSYGVQYTLADAAFDFAEHEAITEDLEFSTVVSATIGDIVAGALVTSEGFTTESTIGYASGSFQEGGFPMPFTAALRGLGIRAEMPLNTGTGSSPYEVILGVDYFELGDFAYSMFDPEELLDRGPMSLNVRAEGLMRATTNPMALATFGMGMSPFAMETMSFDLAANAFGAVIEGMGNFDMDEALMGGVPIGTAEATATGLDALIDVATTLGLFTDQDLEEIAFYLGAFTIEQSDGSRTIEVEINDQEHLIVNGQRLQ